MEGHATHDPWRLQSGLLLHIEHGSDKECRSILRDEASVYFNVTAVHV